MQKKMFFDIETIPCDESVRDIYLAVKKKTYSAELAEEVVEKVILETSFDGGFGRICCIAYIKEGVGKLEKVVLKGDEKEIIKSFWEAASDVTLFIGHNVFDFDIPFIYKRSIINGIKPRYINLARYRNDNVFDTMFEWEKWVYGKKVKLDTLAKIFSLPTSKDEMDGSQVWPAFKEGKIDDICKYCMKDVELTRKVYYRMNVDNLPEEMDKITAHLTDDIPF